MSSSLMSHFQWAMKVIHQQNSKTHNGPPCTNVSFKVVINFWESNFDLVLYDYMYIFGELILLPAHQYHEYLAYHNALIRLDFI